MLYKIFVGAENALVRMLLRDPSVHAQGGVPKDGGALDLNIQHAMLFVGLRRPAAGHVPPQPGCPVPPSRPQLLDG